MSGDVLTLLRRDWQGHLRNVNRAANTQRIYDTVARQFCEWLVGHDRPLDPREIGKRDIEDFMGHMTATRSAFTANVAYRALQQWFKWMMAEEEIDRSPMERTSPPFVPEKAVPVLLSIEQMRGPTASPLRVTLTTVGTPPRCRQDGHAAAAPGTDRRTAAVFSPRR